MFDRSRILIAEPTDFSPAALRVLQEAGEVVCENRTGDALAAAFAEFDAVWLRLAHRIDGSVLGDRPRTRVLALAVTGTDHVDADACRARGVEVISLRGETEFLRTVRATAELTIAILLALLRHVPQAVESTRRGEWERDRFRGHELYGKVAGIVGMGRLGTIVAEYLRAMGMRVLGTDPREDFPAHVAERVSLDVLLKESNVISLHVPYGPATRHLVGAQELALMRRDAVLVNTSRGGVLDEAALIESLEQGRLAGAALDVLDGEPGITPSHPILAASRRLPNLLVVPHLGGNTYESFEKTEVFIARKVAAALAANRAAR